MTGRGCLVLAFSGGLDTQVALHWLSADQGWEVIAYIAEIGQRDTAAAAAVAEKLGSQSHVVDCREEFARDYVFAAGRGNAVYSGQYLMGPSLGRPLIAARQVQLARQLGADAVGHGATGRGNDQVRFELTYAALGPELTVVAPWRQWPFRSRSDLLAYAAAHDLPVAGAPEGRPFSVDESLVHTSYEGEVLEDPAAPPPPGLLRRVADSVDAPEPELVAVTFEQGNPVAVDGTRLGPVEAINALNAVGARHGIGRLDLVEDRIFGLKTRNVYEAPATTLLWHAHRAVESLTLDPEVAQLREDWVPGYARMIYSGRWHTPERRMMQVAIDASNEVVTGKAVLRLHAGGVQVWGRTSPNSLYRGDLATFEGSTDLSEDAASGWLQVESLRLRGGAR